MMRFVTALLVFGGSLSVVGAAETERPNIVLIMADDVGCDAIGCYGGESYPTPNIDRLAAGGLRFNHCYSMPACHPTRICLMTGQYPRRLKNPKWGSFPRDVEKNTFGRVLQRAGYATAVAGKWQLSLLGTDLKQPNRMGFEQYSLFGWHEGARYYQPLIWQNGKRRDDVAEFHVGIPGGIDVHGLVVIFSGERNHRVPLGGHGVANPGIANRDIFEIQLGHGPGSSPNVTNVPLLEKLRIHSSV